MSMHVQDVHTKEATIFNHNGNKIKTEDKEVDIIARFEEPLIVVLGSQPVTFLNSCDNLSVIVSMWDGLRSGPSLLSAPA